MYVKQSAVRGLEQLGSKGHDGSFGVPIMEEYKNHVYFDTRCNTFVVPPE
jgi:hypothetical protein